MPACPVLAMRYSVPSMVTCTGRRARLGAGDLVKVPGVRRFRPAIPVAGHGCSLVCWAHGVFFKRRDPVCRFVRDEAAKTSVVARPGAFHSEGAHGQVSLSKLHAAE